MRKPYQVAKFYGKFFTVVDTKLNGTVTVFCSRQEAKVHAAKDEYSQTSFYLVPFPMKGFGAYKFRVFAGGQVMGESTLNTAPQPEVFASGVK